jgi:arylsulfatase A-like enzyme
MPEGLSENEIRSWAYQRYIKDYLRVIASIDDNVGRMLDYLEENALADNTLIVYTSDQGFFLGDHGWYDKRFMYEQSLRMPLIMSCPNLIKAGQVCDQIVTNVDFAPTFLELSGSSIPQAFQGRSFKVLLEGEVPSDWQQAMYYRYWMNKADHNVAAHYGVRTKRYKLIYYYYDGLDQAGTQRGHCAGRTDDVIDLESLPPEWELFDLESDSDEMRNVYDDPAYADVKKEMTELLDTLQKKVGDTPYKGKV